MDERERADAELRGHLEPALGAAGATMLLDRLPPPGVELVTIAHLDGLERRLASQFDRVDERFDRIDARFAQVDERLAQVDERLAQVDERVDRIDARLKQIDGRLADHDLRFIALDQRLIGVDAQIQMQSSDLRREMNDIVGAAFRSQLLFVLFGTAGLVFAVLAAATGLAVLL